MISSAVAVTSDAGTVSLSGVKFVTFGEVTASNVWAGDQSPNVILPITGLIVAERLNSLVSWTESAALDPSA